jgi:nitrogen fixation protein NifU and related proteins
MYPTDLIYLYKHPHNFGSLPVSTSSQTVRNRLCGDIITMQVEVVGGVVKAVAFEGDSCVICRSSASLLTDYMKKKSVEKLMKVDTVFMTKLLPFEISPARLPCLLLPMEAMKKVLT